MVEYLADNLADDPLLLICTARDEPGPTRALIRRLVDRGVAGLELAALDQMAVTEMATACLGERPAARLLALLCSRADGVPLLVEELIATGRTHREDIVVPATVAELTRVWRPCPRRLALPAGGRCAGPRDTCGAA